MGNIPFLILLGSLSALAHELGLSLELIIGLIGTVMSVYALIKAEISERLLKQIAGDLGKLGELREELRASFRPRGLAGLLRRLFRPEPKERAGSGES
jgi:hypothetical protein